MSEVCPYCGSDYVAWPDPEVDRPDDELDCLDCGRAFEATPEPGESAA